MQEDTKISLTTEADPEHFEGAWICYDCAATFTHAGEPSTCPQCNSLLTAISAQPFEGTDVGKQFEFVSLLGCGGWGLVFKARQLSLGRYVAIKILHPHLACDRERADRFRREAALISQLNHPNITMVFDSGILPSGQPYFVMEYLPGTSLDEVLKNRVRLPASEAMPLFEQMCAGLQAAHSQNIIHRDLKPGNIRLVDTSGGGTIVKIMDFGLARALDASTSPTRLTRTGQTVGTPLYMSPEQCQGQPVDARSDLYSLGCVWYEMLSGKPPADGASVYEVMHKQVSERPAPFKDADANVPNALQAIVLKMLEKAPANRFQSPAELAGALKVCDSTVNSPSLPRAFSLRRPATVVAIGLGLAALGALSMNFMMSHYQMRSPSRVNVESAPAKVQNPPPPSAQRQEMLRGLLSTHVVDGDLRFSRIPINDSDFAFILDQLEKTHTRCVDFWLDHTGITDVSLARLADHSNLDGVNLSYTAVTDAGVEKLSTVNTLKWLTIEDTAVTGKAFRSGFPRVDSVGMDKSFDVSTLPAIANLPRLRELRFNHTKVGDADLAVLSRCTQLEILQLEGTLVTDRGMKYLKGLPLKLLGVMDTAVTVAGLTPLTRCPIENLQVSEIDDDGLAKISRWFKLKTLHFSVTRVTPAGFRTLLSQHDLTELGVYGAIDDRDWVNDACAREIAKLKSLQDLDLESGVVTDQGVYELARLPKLTTLSLSCPKVTTKAVDSLRRQMPHCRIWLSGHD